MKFAKATLGSAGRVVLPAEVRDSLGLKEGDQVLFAISEETVEIYTYARHIARVQAAVRARMPKGSSLVDDLIRERRAEARREAAEGEAWRAKRGRAAE